MILDTSFLIDLLRGKDQSSKAKAEELDNEFKVKIKEGYVIHCLSVFRTFLDELFSVLKKANTKQVYSSHIKTET